MYKFNILAGWFAGWGGFGFAWMHKFNILAQWIEGWV
jgi:hypothetical protein